MTWCRLFLHSPRHFTTPTAVLDTGFWGSALLHQICDWRADWLFPDPLMAWRLDHQFQVFMSHPAGSTRRASIRRTLLTACNSFLATRGSSFVSSPPSVVHCGCVVVRFFLSCNYELLRSAPWCRGPRGASCLLGGVVPPLRGLLELPPAGGSLGKPCGTRPSSQGGACH